jgi:probable phosphomutase (TIGR03848 family)
MARLLLIRHALTVRTGQSLSGRLPGISLSEAGTQMAAALAARLKHVRLAAVYCSPLERTQETAAEITRHRAIEPILHDGLLEVDYGDWSGRSMRSLYRLKGWQVVRSTPSRIRFPGGESLAAAAARSITTCEDLAARHPRQTVAAVTHADMIKAAVTHYLGAPLDLFSRVHVAPASVTVIDLLPGRPPHVVTVNSNGEPSTWP